MQEVIDDSVSEVTHLQSKRARLHENALKNAAVSHDKVEFSRKANLTNDRK